jgi:hypothetical protein
MIASARPSLFLAAMAAGVLAGCGSGGTASHSRSQSRSTNRPAAPAPEPARTPADPASVRVIRAWSTTLRHGDVHGAARYFALPSEMIYGQDRSGQLNGVAIHTRVQAEAANAALPCGAVFISADRRGRYVNALFLLTDRPGPGGGCGSGTGLTARTAFVITKGHIVQWVRAPNEPGDGRRPAPRGPGNPSTPQGPGAVV